MSIDTNRKAAVEKYVTLKTAASEFGVPLFKMVRAAKRGFFPTYTFYNSRKLVLLSEVAAAFKAVKHD